MPLRLAKVESTKRILKANLVEQPKTLFEVPQVQTQLAAQSPQIIISKPIAPPTPIIIAKAPVQQPQFLNIQSIRSIPSSSTHIKIVQPKKPRKKSSIIEEIIPKRQSVYRKRSSVPKIQNLRFKCLEIIKCFGPFKFLQWMIYCPVWLWISLILFSGALLGLLGYYLYFSPVLSTSNQVFKYIRGLRTYFYEQNNTYTYYLPYYPCYNSTADAGYPNAPLCKDTTTRLTSVQANNARVNSYLYSKSSSIDFCFKKYFTVICLFILFY